MTELAHGTIGLDLNDKDVIAGLRAVDAQFNRTMDEIERRKAIAKIDADLRPLERQLERAKRQVREFESERAKAVRLGLDTAEFDTKIENAQREVKELDGKRAVVQLRVEGQREFHRQLSEANNLLYEQERAINRAAAADRKRQYDSSVGADKEVTKILRLQKEYARLTDKLEALDKKRPIGREARAKVELDATGVVARMRVLKAELEFLGSHPPVEIKADLNRRGLDRVAHTFGDFLTKLGNKASGLSDLSLRLGPFTTSLRGLGLALGFLGPTLTDLLGATGSLIGVLGAGIAGAAALGAGGITGMAGAFLGLKFATRNTGQEIANARTAINAYQKQVEKTGASSDKAKTKLTEMNHVLSSISPLAREAALGTEKFFTAWDKSTGPTRNSLGRIAHDGFAALNALRPMWAARTNEMSGMLQKGLSSGFSWLSRGPGRGLLGGIFKDFNAQIPTLLHGLGQFGEAFLRFAREGARNLDVLVNGFDNLGTKLNNFTKQDNFGQTVKRWVTYAQDVMRFFGAATRVLVHFFGDGSKAGDTFINTMTKALNRWDSFLTSTNGKNRMGKFFSDSVKGTQQLYNALKPIIQLFALWATGLEPAVTVITSIAAAITNAGAAVGRLIGLGNPLKTLGMTLGAVFAVSKIGGFVSMLARAVVLMKDLAAAKGIGGLVKSLASGSFMTTLRSGGGIAAAGETAAVAMRQAIISGGTVAAAEMRAATGGGLPGLPGRSIPGTSTVGTAERVATAEGAVLGGATAAELATAETAAAGTATEAAGATAALGELATAGAGLAGPIGLGVAALAGLVIAFGDTRTSNDKLRSSMAQTNAEVAQGGSNYQQASNDTNRHVNAVNHLDKSLKGLRRTLKDTKDGTEAHRQAERDLYTLENKRNAQIAQRSAAAKEAKAGADAQVASLTKLRDQTKGLNKDEIAQAQQKLKKIEAQNKQASMDPHSGSAWETYHNKILSLQAQVTDEAAAATRRLAAARIVAAAASLNEQRAARGQRVTTGRQAQSLGRLAQRAPSLAQHIALKYDSPQDVGQIAAAASRALAAGVRKPAILKIMADSKNVEQALRRINSIEIKKKLLQMGITGHNGVLSKLDAIDRKDIKAKIARILESGHAVTMARLAQIIQTVIPDKHFSIQSAAGQALLQLQLVASGLSRIQSKTITVSVKRLGAFPHAEGLKLGGATHDALIGEGRGAEWHVNRRKGFAYKTRGPMFARVGPDDAIIPTEPAYRNKGRTIMHEIATDLGMHMYAKSKPPAPKAAAKKAAAPPAAKPKKPVTASTQSAPAAKKHLARVSDYKAAAVPLDYAQGEVDAAQKIVDKDASDETKYKDAIKSANEALKYAKKGSTTKKRAEDKKTAAEKALKTLHREHPKHVTARNEAKTRLNDLKAANDKIEHLNSLIATDKTLMDNAATRYETSQSDVDLHAWEAARDDRKTQIKTLGTILRTALAKAKKIKAPGIQGLLDQLGGDIDNLDGTAQENAGATPPSAATLDLATFLKDLGRYDTYKKDLADIAVAKTDNVPDDPGTAAREDLDSLKNDQTAADALVSFFADNKILAAAQATGNSDLITETADAISSARDNAQGIADTVNTAAAQTGPSQVDLMDTARGALYKDYGSNYNPNGGGSGPSAPGGGGVQTNPAMLSTPPNAAGIAVGSSQIAGSLRGASSLAAGVSSGSAAAPAAGANVTVNNHFTAPPEDPHTWSSGVKFELGALV